MAEVHLTYSHDLMAFKIVRVTRDGDTVKYLSGRGWLTKQESKPLDYDDTMIWSEQELLSLLAAIVARKKNKEE